MAAKNTLKIGFVLDVSLDPPDGVQQYVVTLGEWLRAKGHDVHYLVGETHRTDLRNVHSLSKNVSVRFNGNRTAIPLPTSRRRLRRFLQSEQFDVLHVQVPYNPLLARHLIMAAGPQTAVIGTFHIAPASQLVTVANKALAYWLKASLKRFDVMLSVSEAAANFAQETFHMTSRVLPNVIEYERFHQAQPLKAYQDKVPTILFLGRLVPRKGCRLLLEAVQLLAQNPDTPKFRVLICGNGPLRGELQAYVRSHRLKKTVTFTGFVDENDKPSYYAAADIAVFPSVGGESFGIVLLEAMAAGRAVVLGGDNPGYRTVLATQPDLLFDPTDAVALASKLADFLVNDRRRLALASWGEQYARQFDVAAVGADLLKIYRQALRNRAQK